MRVDVAVDRVGDDLGDLTFIDAFRLGVIGGNMDPPPAIDVDERVRDSEGGKILHPDGIKGQKYDEQSVAHPNGTCVRRLAKRLGLANQCEAGFDQALGENQPISLGSWDHASAISFSISVSQAKSLPGATNCAARRSL